MSKKQIEYIVENTASHAMSSFETKFRKLFSENTGITAFTRALEEKTEEELNIIEAVVVAYLRVENDLKDTKKRLGRANDNYMKLNNQAKRDKNTLDSLNFMIHQMHRLGDEY